MNIRTVQCPLGRIASLRLFGLIQYVKSEHSSSVYIFQRETKLTEHSNAFTCIISMRCYHSLVSTFLCGFAFIEGSQLHCFGIGYTITALGRMLFVKFSHDQDSGLRPSPLHFSIGLFRIRGKHQIYTKIFLVNNCVLLVKIKKVLR